MTNNIEKWEIEIKRLNNMVAPIANAPVDLKYHEVSFNQKEENILEGVNNSSQALLTEIIDEYIICNERKREQIRNLFDEYDSFAWAANYEMQNHTSIEVKRYLAFLSILDQGKDTRDYIMACSAIFDDFIKSGIAYKNELIEIINISGKENKYGMGSTANILRRWC